MADRALYNANDGLSGRDGGPYLDQEEQRLAEIRRAKIEGREPDFDHPGAVAGTVLVTADQLLANNGVNNLPSTDGSNLGNAEAAVRALADDDSNNLRVHAVIPEEAFSPEPEAADLSMQSALMTDGNVPVGEKNDEPYEPSTENGTTSESANSESVVSEPASTEEQSSVDSEPPAAQA